MEGRQCRDPEWWLCSSKGEKPGPDPSLVALIRDQPADTLISVLPSSTVRQYFYSLSYLFVVFCYGSPSQLMGLASRLGNPKSQWTPWRDVGRPLCNIWSSHHTFSSTIQRQPHWWHLLVCKELINVCQQLYSLHVIGRRLQSHTCFFKIKKFRTGVLWSELGHTEVRSVVKWNRSEPSKS